MQEYEPEPAEDPDAKIEPIVDHGAIVQGFLNDPAKKLVLRKDDSADKMLSVTKFTNNNTMLGSILSDIASRMLTRDDNEERVANFASRVADGLENEGELFNKPDQDWMKNKKIAIQLARRYIDDYRKMQKDPTYADEIRQDPGAFKPKKDRAGKPKEDAFEQWANRITEGTWSLPTPEHAGDNYEKLISIMENPLEVGTDAMNATQMLSSVGFGDDSLYDTLGSLYDKEGEKADARVIVKEYVLEKLVPADHFTDTLSPEMKQGLSQAVTSFKDPSEKQMELPGLERDKEKEPAFNSTFEEKIKEFETRLKEFQNKQELPRQLKDPKADVMVSKDGKTIVIDKNKEQEYLAKGWALAESINESKTKVDSGFNIAGIEGENDRVTGEAGLQIARLKYLSNYH